jgi:hypothetical protein
MDDKIQVQGKCKSMTNELLEARQEMVEELDHPLDKVIKNDLLRVEMKQTEGFIRNSFTSAQNVHLNNSLRFADTKAGALVTVNGLVLSYVTNLISTSSGVSNWFFKASLLIIIVGILYSIAVVYPRSLNSKDKGLVYWEHITNYKKDDYVKAIIDENVSELLRNSVENNYAQASILTSKFKKLEIGFKISIAGYLAIAIGLIINFVI